MSKRKQGELESAIMGCLWDRPEGLSSNQILALLGDDELAITTVLTVLSRLGEQGPPHKAAGGWQEALVYFHKDQGGTHSPTAARCNEGFHKPSTCFLPFCKLALS